MPRRSRGSAPLTLSFANNSTVRMTKSKAAFLLASDVGKRQLSFHVDVHFQRFVRRKGHEEKWNYLLTLLLRAWPMLRGLRVFELHKEHGLHVIVTNSFIDVNRARALAEKAGWGRIHVKRIVRLSVSVTLQNI